MAAPHRSTEIWQAVRGAVAALVGLCSVPAAHADGPVAADTVLRNGTIFTLDARNTMAYVIALRDGRIVYVGNDAGSKAFIGAATHVTDVHSHMIMPGVVEGQGSGTPDASGRSQTETGAHRAEDPVARKAMYQQGITTFGEAVIHPEPFAARLRTPAGVWRVATLRGFTIDAARALHRDADIGSLEVGKQADLILLDRNVLSTPADQLPQTQVLMTVVAGKEVFHARAF